MRRGLGLVGGGGEVFSTIIECECEPVHCKKKKKKKIFHNFHVCKMSIT